jgi:hypothetical protein
LCPGKLKLFTCCYKVDLHVDRVIACRKPSEGGPSKTIEQQLAITQTISSVAAAFALPRVGGTCLMVCSNSKTRHSTQRVLQYLEKWKDVEADPEGTLFSFAAPNL